MRNGTCDTVPLVEPSLGEEEIDVVGEVLRSKWITSGPQVEEFEREFARYVGTADAVAVQSCTSALYLCLQALDIPQGSKVLVPAFTWPSAVSAVMSLGLTPVIVDVDRETLNVTLQTLRPYMDESVLAIIPLHFAGLPYPVDDVVQLASKYDVRVIDDAAHAMGSHVDGCVAGKKAYAACYSFHPTKNMTTGEGGMIATDGSELAHLLRRLRLLGVDRDAWSRYGEDTAVDPDYDVTHLALKHNMTDIQAALGRVQLKKLDQLNRQRYRIAQRYLEELHDVEGLVLPEEGSDNISHSWHLFVPRTVDREGKFGRNAVVRRLKERGVSTGFHFRPIPCLSFFQEELGLDPEDTPNAVCAGRTVFSLPLYPELSEENQRTVIAAVRDVMGR